MRSDELRHRFVWFFTCFYTYHVIPPKCPYKQRSCRHQLILSCVLLWTAGDAEPSKFSRKVCSGDGGMGSLDRSPVPHIPWSLHSTIWLLVKFSHFPENPSWHFLRPATPAPSLQCQGHVLSKGSIRCLTVSTLNYQIKSSAYSVCSTESELNGGDIFIKAT